jgi:hypothetical protein
MLSENARMASAAEARFRISDPNSRPRTVKVIALDPASERLVKRLAAEPWKQAVFLIASAFAGAPREGARFSVQGWLSDLAGRTKDLVEEVRSADLVVMVATSGENAQGAALIGEACSLHRVMTTALIIGCEEHSDAELAETLTQLRPHARMIVIAGYEDYVSDMLHALRA